MLSTTLDTMRRIFGATSRPAPQDFAPTRPAREAGADLIYRLKAWPQLPESGRTAEVYRIISVMSSRPVNRAWILANSRLDAQQLDALLERLAADGSLEVIDPARFAGRESSFQV